MDVNWLLLTMSEEERKVFFENEGIDYYSYIVGMDEFQRIQKKAKQGEKLDSEEWNFMIGKLFLIYFRSMNQIGDFDFAARFFSFLAKLGLKIGKKYGSFYNECYKMKELIWNLEIVDDMHQDLLVGIEQLLRYHNEEDLEDVLNQYQMSQTFLDTKRAYEEAYRNTIVGKLSSNEKLYIHATHHAYEEEKKLVKRYQQKHY